MSCQTINTGINAACDTATGGVVKVMIGNSMPGYVFEGDVAEWLSNAVVTDPEEGIPAWYKFTFRKQSASLTQTLTRDDAQGIQNVATDLVLQFPRMDATKRAVINDLFASVVKVCVKDANGSWYLLGVNEDVTITAADGQTGTARGDANRYSVTFQDIHPEFPFVFEEGSNEADTLDQFYDNEALD